MPSPGPIPAGKVMCHPLDMNQMHGGPPAGASPTCANCGAPDPGELVICKFCKQAVSAEASRTAIPCPNPQCRTLCRWGKQKCVQCQAWLVVSCVFCGAISPHNISNCMQCNEAFAGAPQRKAQLEQQRQHQQNMQNANVWGNIAASFLGAAAGAAVSHSWDSDYDGPSSVDTFDISGVSDDSSFDFGGDD
jgi:hypothetical protein